MAGTNYLLTLLVGESDCPVTEDFSQEDCVINLDHGNNRWGWHWTVCYSHLSEVSGPQCPLPLHLGPMMHP